MFIDEHKDRFGGVEPICRVLREHGHQIATSTYYKTKALPPSTRTVRDERVLAEIGRVHASNYGVYGARKVWQQLRREGHPVARCTVERLMRTAGLVGVVRGKKIRTTITNPDHQRPGDLIRRDFTAGRPNRRWVADFTHVATFAGVVYVAFVVDLYSRAIVGWSAATNKRTPLVLDALDMGLWRRDRDGRAVEKGLIHHSDAGSQYTSFRFATHLVDAGIDASIGTVGDALDNALMESTIGLYKTELIKPRRPWRTLAQVELATAEWVDWYNHRRLHSAIGNRPPAEHESMFYAHTPPTSRNWPQSEDSTRLGAVQPSPPTRPRAAPHIAPHAAANPIHPGYGSRHTQPQVPPHAAAEPVTYAATDPAPLSHGPPTQPRIPPYSAADRVDARASRGHHPPMPTSRAAGHPLRPGYGPDGAPGVGGASAPPTPGPHGQPLYTLLILLSPECRKQYDETLARAVSMASVLVDSLWSDSIFLTAATRWSTLSELYWSQVVSPPALLSQATSVNAASPPTAAMTRARLTRFPIVTIPSP